MPGPLLIAVIGENDPPPGLAQLAEEVGGEIAAAGAVLVCGGLGGTMEAACRGAQRRGGVSIGLLPGTRPEDANPHVTYPILRARDAKEAVALALKAAQARPR